jgi:ABC-type antimicrobial peptide transport system ATPase subunit
LVSAVVVLGVFKSYYRVCLDRAKNSARIEELRIANEDSKKIVIFSISAMIVKR